MWKRIQLARLGAASATFALAATALAASTPAQATIAPSVVAVSQVQNLINTVRGQAGSYAGLWIDNASDTVYVSASKAGVTPGTVEALTPRAAVGGATMKLVLVHATYSFAQLEAIDGRVIHDKGLQRAAKASHATLSEWYPDPETDKVVIGFTKVTPAERAEVRAEYGTTARVITAQLAESAVGKGPLTATRSPRTVHADVSRTADSAPWYGGDEIGGGGFLCTSGFDWANDSMTTAGHCGSTAWTNNGVYVGTTFTLQWGGGRIDMQRMDGSSYLPYIWAGANGTTPEPVSGSGGVAQGAMYCVNGYRTGQNCNAVVDAIDVCRGLNDNGTEVNVCDLDEAESYNDSVLVQPGDSGGPVYTSNSKNDPYAVGTISGRLDNGLVVVWSDMYMEKVIFGSGPTVGT
jgi:hypothetical protein